MAFGTTTRHIGALVVVGFALASGLALSGCSTATDTARALNPDPPGKMFADGDAALQRGSYYDAAKKFEDLDRDHPYAPEARRAMVMAAFAHYKSGKFPEAIAAAKRYTTMHPGTKEAALAHHIIASAHFDEIKDPARDQTATRQALSELRLIKTRYPDSPYAKQAETRIRIAEDVLAASEMNVGRYYLKSNNFVAAINRFKVVVAEYQTTAHVEEALMRLTESYLALGIRNEAQSAAAVLGHNFPQSRWYKDAYALLQKNGLGPQEGTGTWVSRAWRGLVKPSSTPTSAPAADPAPGAPPAPATPPAERETLPPPSSSVPTASTGRRPVAGFAGMD
jgi:outer membrane protein assembly factor BamD